MALHSDWDSIINCIVSPPILLELEEGDNSILIDNCSSGPDLQSEGLQGDQILLQARNVRKPQPGLKQERNIWPSFQPGYFTLFLPQREKQTCPFLAELCVCCAAQECCSWRFLKLRAEFLLIVAALIVDLETAGPGWGFINHPVF